MRILIALFLSGTLLACSDSTKDGNAEALNPNFFNLTDFVAEEQARLLDMSITKTVTVNDITETQELQTVDWELELAPFAQSNIDRPALWDSFSVDTSISCKGQTLFTYTSLDSSNFTKSINILWSDVAMPLDSVFALSIYNGFNSFIANTGQHLVWWRDGYEIESTQEAILSEPRTLRIKSTWGDKQVGACVEGFLE